MALKVPAFTKSALLQEVQYDDNTLHIVGYVESIQGQQTVGHKRCFNLFKFVLTNGELKVKILIWEDQIPLYASHIKFHEIIEFINIQELAVDTQYNKIEQDFLTYDLSIQRSTKVIFHGQLNSSQAPLLIMPEKNPIKYAAAYQGKKTVEGYLCIPFIRITTGQGTCSFASGAVSDGNYKLRLHVANYVEIPVLVSGAHVAITGIMKKSEKNESVFMQLEHMAEIKIIDDKIISSEEIENCFRKPLSELPASDEMITHLSVPASHRMAAIIDDKTFISEEIENCISTSLNELPAPDKMTTRLRLSASHKMRTSTRVGTDATASRVRVEAKSK